jgi:Sulfotransferase family
MNAKVDALLDGPDVNSPLRGRMLFLVGARRSGTNWLERVLTTHPKVVAMPTETYLFSHGIQRVRDLLQHSAPGIRTTGTTYMGRDTFRAAARRFCDEIFLENLEALDPAASFLLERTPWHAQHLDLIAGIYPDAHVIHIIRDGRAVARSLVSMGWGPSTIREAADEWRDCVAGGLKGRDLFGERYIEVRYEDLLANPVNGAETIYEWLGLGLDGGVLEQVALEAGTKFNVDSASPTVATDKWRAEITAEDLQEFDAAAGTLARQLGYRDPDPRPGAAVPSPERSADASSQPGLGPRLKRSARRLRRSPAAEFDPAGAREAKKRFRANLAAAQQFDVLLDDGRTEEARALCAPEASFSVLTEGHRVAGRGDAYFEELMAALAALRAPGTRVIRTDQHVGANLFSHVTTHELPDGRRVATTKVIGTNDALITSYALHQFEIAPADETA